MTDKEFCELDSQFYGEKISNIKQIALRSFDGDELKEYVEHCIKLSKLSQHDVSNRRKLLIAFMESLNREDLTQIEIAEFESVADKFLGN